MMTTNNCYLNYECIPMNAYHQLHPYNGQWLPHHQKRGNDEKSGSGIILGLFTVGIFGLFFIPFLGHSHDSHYFSLLFSSILTFSLPPLMRMKEKVEKNNGNHENGPKMD